MSDKIKKIDSPNTVDTLCNELKAFGITKCDTVIVHSSLSSLGYVCGGQAAVVEALLKSVGEDGTIVMPAQTGNHDPAGSSFPLEWHDTIRQNMPVFNKDITTAHHMGRIAECFRTYPGTLRSDHPCDSFTANGKLAKQITENHVLSPSLGMDTPLGSLYRLGAKVLLIGVDYSVCTAFHLSEALSGRVEIIKTGSAVLEKGSRVWKTYEDFDYDSDDFQQIGLAYEAVGIVHAGKIGVADCKLFDFKSAVDFATEWIKNNRVKSN